MSQRMKRILGAGALGAVATLFLSSGAISGAVTPLHLELDRSEPAADAVLEESPDAITLWFTQAPQMAGTSIRLVQAGEPLELGRASASEADPAEITLAIPSALEDGEYTVAWRAMASDGHVVRGDFSFTVRSGR